MNSERIPFKIRRNILISGPISRFINLILFLDFFKQIAMQLLWFINSFAALIIQFSSLSMTLFKYLTFFLCWVKCHFVETILHLYAAIISLMPLPPSFLGIYYLSMSLFLWKLQSWYYENENALWDMNLLYPESSLDKNLRTLLKYSISTLSLLVVPSKEMFSSIRRYLYDSPSSNCWIFKLLILILSDFTCILPL